MLHAVPNGDVGNVYMMYSRYNNNNNNNIIPEAHIENVKRAFDDMGVRCPSQGLHRE
jgi:hypothetical protein